MPNVKGAISSPKGLAQGVRGVGELACYQESSAEPQNYSGTVGRISFGDDISR